MDRYFKVKDGLVAAVNIGINVLLLLSDCWVEFHISKVETCYAPAKAMQSYITASWMILLCCSISLICSISQQYHVMCRKVTPLKSGIQTSIMLVANSLQWFGVLLIIEVDGDAKYNFNYPMIISMAWSMIIFIGFIMDFVVVMSGKWRNLVSVVRNEQEVQFTV